MDSENLSLEGKKARRMALIYKKDDHHYIQCPHCENEIPFEEEKLLNVFKKTPWWVYIIVLTAIAVIDYRFFFEFVVHPVLKVVLLLTGIWAAGVILFPVTTIFTDLFSKDDHKEVDLNQTS